MVKKKRLLTSIDIGDGKFHTVQQILLLDWPFAILTQNPKDTILT